MWAVDNQVKKVDMELNEPLRFHTTRITAGVPLKPRVLGDEFSYDFSTLMQVSDAAVSRGNWKQAESGSWIASPASIKGC